MLITYIILFFIAFTLATIATPVVRLVALHYKVTDRPGSRKMHTKLITRFGGVSVYIGIVVTLFLGYQLSAVVRGLIEENLRLLTFVMTGATILLIVGALDDRYNLSAWRKLSFQVIAGLLSYYGGLHLYLFEESGLGNPIWQMTDLLLTVCWIVVITNAINLIDGLDGLAAGITAIILLLLSWISHDNGFIMASLMATITAGSVVGFLRYNIFPARVFLGDSGSLLLGYLLANLTIHGTQQKSTLSSLTIALLLLSVPLLDTFLAIARRLMNGHGIFSPDGNHIHHRLIKRGIKHPVSVIILWGMTLIFGIAALLYSSNDVQYIHKYINIFSVSLIGFLSINFMSNEIKEHINALRTGNQRIMSPRKKNLAVRRAVECIKGTDDFNRMKHQLGLLAEKIGVDLMHIEVTYSDKVNNKTKNEIISWSSPVLNENDTANVIGIISSLHKSQKGDFVCKVDLGREKLKLRRKSEDDQMWADRLSCTIVDVCSKMPYADRNAVLQHQHNCGKQLILEES